MFSKMSNKTLVIVLLVLGVALYFALFADHSDSSYKNEVINVDTARVTKIKFDLPDKGTFELVKSGTSWLVKSGDEQSAADQNRVRAFLSQMAPLKTIRVAGKVDKDSKKLGLDEKSALKVDFFNGDKMLSTLFLGKVNYEAPESGGQNLYSRGNQGRMIGYAFTNGDNTAYVVDGYLKISYGSDANGFKNKVVVDADPKSVSEIDMQSGKVSLKLTKSSNKWMIDGQATDSAETAKYVNALVRLSGYEFLDKDVIKGIEPVGSVTIKTLNDGLIKVDAYPVDSVTFALVSSQNNGNIIKDKKHRIFDRMFKEKSYFLK